MSAIAGTGLPTTGALPSTERVYRTPKGVRIHGEIPPPPAKPNIPTDGNLSEEDKQKLRAWGRAKADYAAKYKDELDMRAWEALAKAKAEERTVFAVKKGGQVLVKIDNDAGVSITEAGKTAGISIETFRRALDERDAQGLVLNKGDEIAWRIAYFIETLGLNNEGSGYEVVNAFAPVGSAKTGSPDDLRSARNGYLLGLFS